LFVCEQNVCRSPLMAAAFDGALHADGLPETDAVEWVIGSAGTQASPRRSACRFVVAIEPEAAHHVSHRLEVDDVEAAGLIIAATLEERSLIVQLSPSARSRTFTLREALLLGEQPVAATSLAEYAAALASRRGTLDLRPPRGFPWIRPAHRPLDVVDVHMLGPKPHRRGLLDADADARLLAARLQRDLSVPR
jgi:protein-tyrosine-phosphatase